MNVPFLQDTTFTGLISTKNYGTSRDWSIASSIVQAYSATWEESAEIVPTVTNFLSSNHVFVSSVDVKGPVLSSGVDLFDIFITSAEESQTLTYEPTSYNLSIDRGNTVNLSSIVISPNASAIFRSLSTQSITATEIKNLENAGIEGELSVGTKILSGGIDLFDLFLTSDEESQTLTYNVTGETLSIDRGNTVSLSALSYRNIHEDLSAFNTIQEFAQTYSGSIHPGYNVTLRNGRVYTFAGTDKNNFNHYLEVNANPYKPIYREVPLSANETVVDSFYLGDFKTAKYTLQVETNFNNEIYYSEINVVGSVQTSTGVASEYGQIYTSQLVLYYDVRINLNTLEFVMYNNYDPDPSHKYLVKGHRTNFYKI